MNTPRAEEIYNLGVKKLYSMKYLTDLEKQRHEITHLAEVAVSWGVDFSEGEYEDLLEGLE